MDVADGEYIFYWWILINITISFQLYAWFMVTPTDKQKRDKQKSTVKSDVFFICETI